MNAAARHPGPVRALLARTLLALCACVCVSATARAQPFEAAPQPAAPRPLSIEAPIEQLLPNGLRVVLAERRGVQLVTAELLVLSGSEADPPQRAGLASITAGLLTKGTTRRSASALASAAEALGGTLDSAAGWHRSQVGMTVMVAQLDAALRLIAETVRQPAFAQAELDRLRGQTLDELKVAYARPGTLAALVAQRLLFGNGAYGHPGGGTPASLQRIARADLLALHATHYRPDNAVLLFAGDLDAASALRLAQRHFGNWQQPRRAALAAAAPAPARAMAQPAAVIDMPQSGQAAVVVAASVPPPGADRATAAVLNAVLGGGFSSRLNQEIRIRRGLSYSAGSQLDARRAGGALRLVVQTKNESAAEVVTLLQNELDRLIAAPVAEAELAARKATLIGDFSRSIETTAGLAAAVESLVVAGLATRQLTERIEALGAVGAADVQRFAAKHLGAAARRIAVAGVAQQFGDAMKAAVPSFLTVPAVSLNLDGEGGLLAP